MIAHIFLTTSWRGKKSDPMREASSGLSATDFV